MRHRKSGRKLGRNSSHRKAMYRNMVTSLLVHGRIKTTEAKAKELRPFVERLITVAKRGIAEGADTPKALHARRLVARDLADKKVASKLFESIAPRFAERPGGYTRVLQLGRRKGDQAEIAQIELVGSEYDPTEADGDDAVEEAASGGQGVGGRLRAAAKRLRGDAEEGADAEKE